MDLQAAPPPGATAPPLPAAATHHRPAVVHQHYSHLPAATVK